MAKGIFSRLTHCWWQNKCWNSIWPTRLILVGGGDLNKSIPMSFLLLLVNRRLVVWNQYDKETYIKAHLTRLIDGCAVENGRGRDIHGLMNKHGGTKGYRSNTVLFLGAFMSANVPVHLLEITVMALLQIGGGGRGLAHYVSRVCATLPRLRAPAPGRSLPEKVDKENTKSRD